MINPVQLSVFVGITALIGFLTYLHCRGKGTKDPSSGHDYFLANGGLKWYFVAGSITLTNLSTDQLVGMNGNQMLLLAWWEFAAVAGLFILAFVFLPIYYRNDCTTTTELLQKKYNDKPIKMKHKNLNPIFSKVFLNSLYQRIAATSIPYSACSTSTYNTFLPFLYTTYAV